jgi:hypothetical protein
MTKTEVISLVKNLLPKEDKTNKYHYEVVATACGVVYANMVNDVYREFPKELDNYVKTYGVSTAITVATESSTTIKYSTLPVHFIPLPDKASGIRRVDSLIQGGSKFYPVDSREADLLLNGSFFKQSTKIGYIVKPTRVEYVNMQTGVVATGVRMDIVTEFMDLEDTDTIYIPHGKEREFIAGVLEIMGVVPPVDLRDDNADPKTNKQ